MIVVICCLEIYLLDFHEFTFLKLLIVSLLSLLDNRFWGISLFSLFCFLVLVQVFPVFMGLLFLLLCLYFWQVLNDFDRFAHLIEAFLLPGTRWFSSF